MNYKNLNLDYIYLNNNSSINYSYSPPISYTENTIKNQSKFFNECILNFLVD